MRRVRVGTLLRVLLGTAAFAMFGCPGQDLAPLTPCTVSGVSVRVDQAGVSEVDLLFMIDNSGSMASKQKKLADQLPRLLRVLTTGDRCAGSESTCTLDATTTPKRTFSPVKSLHLGVVTSNMGGIDQLPANTNSEGLRSCLGLGDDGVLQNSTAIAVNGVVAASDGEFPNFHKNDSVIDPDPTCASLGDIGAYQEYQVDGDSDLADVQKKFSCVSRVGVRGCPFEQQLEAPWKALAPSNKQGPQYKFLNGSDAHGDTDNEGFLREDAILAILLVTDEDDCSITDAGKVMFAQTKEAQAYGLLNLRCGLNSQDATLIHDTSRYLEGFQSLKPDNHDHVIFAAITGVPPEAIRANATPEEILALPEMQFTPELGAGGVETGIPKISCANADNTEVAYPPIRIVQVARDFGKNGVLYSVCEENYAPALDLLIEKIATKLTGSCLPRKLNPNLAGRVDCEVFELLPSGKTECDPAFGVSGPAKDIDVRENGRVTTRKGCLMNQVPLEGQSPKAGVWGWYYDDFTDDVMMNCPAAAKQRISFQFNGTNDLPSNAGATIECFQRVARIDNDAKGFDAINTACMEGGDECATRSNKKEKGGFDLSCIAKTCQVACKINPECPAGWVCAPSLSDTKNTTGPKYCQQPTCPAGESGGGGSEDSTTNPGGRDAG
ncbi:MAG: hypothetical protein JWN48_280 [Myxococcaceae bacterium]|nr:hypothetical protein [Myxococcaceae bacterium]